MLAAVLVLEVLVILMLTYGLFLSHRLAQANLISLHVQKEQELQVVREALREAQQRLATRKGKQK